MKILRFIGRYVSNIVWSIDIFTNVLTGGNRETISARLGEYREQIPIVDGVCSVLDIIEQNHCEKSREWWDNLQG